MTQDLPALLSLTRSPRVYDPDRVPDAQASTGWAMGQMRELIDGTAGCSPYLCGLIQKEGGWLERAVAEPSEALSHLFEALRAAPPDMLGTDLRAAKRRVALLTALADLGGAWSLGQVTGVLTRFADLAADLAIKAGVAEQVRRKKLPGVTEEDIPVAAGIVGFAMGKMGAGELNYSSDIDLIMLFDESRYDPDSYHDVRAGLVKATRRMVALLNDVTAEGYVFRTDLRLRPDPSVTPVCLAMETAERYYESLGRTWERAAWIKARPCAGDLEAGARFQAGLTPFVWRKHLDFAAIEDAHNMRLAIRSHKGLGGPITLPGHNMKLGRGGIREIEFFTQTRQLIAGGRDPDLRVRGTLEGLRRLVAKGWVPVEAATTLAAHYTHHREVEHRLQMINDAQTHDLPKSDEGFDRLAAFMGVARQDLEADLHSRLEEVHGLIEAFFAPDAKPAPAAEEDTGDLVLDPSITDRWATYPALRSDRSEEIFNRIKPEILRRLAETPRPEEALLAFDAFLAGLPAGVQVFSLFAANPQLLDLLTDIVGTSPDLARYLARNAAVLDGVIGGDFFAPWPGVAALTTDLAQAMARDPDYERKLDAVRRRGKEWHFRVGVHLLRGLADPFEAAQHYADLAEATIAALFPVVQAEFARKYGPCPGRGAAVVGMGSLGAARLHALSDLDVIVVYDAAGVEASEGLKSLPSRTYYARLTQALITAMTAPMAEGRLYELDMRLRPSGNKGPVATSLTAFRDYQMSEAWVWEHLALTRARALAGPKDLCADLEAVRCDVLAQPRDAAHVLAEVATMRRRILAAKGDAGGLEPKLGQGRMQDIELISQAGALLAGAPTRDVPGGLALAHQAGWLSGDAETHLAQTYRRFWSLQIGSRLISNSVVEAESLGAGGLAFLCRLSDCSDAQALVSQLDRQAREAADYIQAVLPKDET